ncbi:MAG: Peptidase C11 clostripain [candidate division TM6 bacterium GW2011_GWF2_32_72]|nr:MAG: Peptidase C11 clostripain [candidate division TM6 bacterium GW2011_GWF2_32_72]
MKKTIFCISNLFLTAAFFATVHSTDQSFESFYPENYSTKNITDKECTEEIKSPKQTKKWTIMVYMAADNDLRRYAIQNIEEMLKIGSTNYANMIIHLDIRENQKKKVTHRYFVEPNKLTKLNTQSNEQCMDSGAPETFIGFCKQAIQLFPAEKYAVIFWNHGTGPLDPYRSKILNPNNFFKYNPNNDVLEIDRSLAFFDSIEEESTLSAIAPKPEGRGICFDDSTRNYITNAKLDTCLEQVRKEALNNAKFDIVGFDACLMSGIEIANIVKKHSKIMIASQEIELAAGWKYDKILQALQQANVSAESLSKTIVDIYRHAYNPITKDLTLSALNMDAIQHIENNINIVSQLLNSALDLQNEQSVITQLKDCRNKHKCTQFEEPSYVDLGHLYKNLAAATNSMKLVDAEKEKQFHKDFKLAISEGLKLIDQSIIDIYTGGNIKEAKGISIYFPEKRIHNSYPYTPFAKTNNWINLLPKYFK